MANATLRGRIAGALPGWSAIQSPGDWTTTDALLRCRVAVSFRAFDERIQALQPVADCSKVESGDALVRYRLKNVVRDYEF